MDILANHIGYAARGAKKALAREIGAGGPVALPFTVRDADSGSAVFEGEGESLGSIASWGPERYWRLDFSELEAEGRFYVECAALGGPATSAVFELRESLVGLRMVNAVACYFKAQRVSGEWAAKDSRLGFEGPRSGEAPRDLGGGWYDASGDCGVHLSHLSHASYFNPQQAAFSAYAFFRAYELLDASGNEQYSMIGRRLLDEGTWGADFLARMREEGGSFLRSKARQGAFGIVSDTRRIELEYRRSSSQFGEAETAAEETITDESYQVSFRSGGGFAIAALAAAARHGYPGAEHSRAEYLEAAKSAYALLEREDERFCNDGKRNLLDEYCALPALVELHRATGEYGYLIKARDAALAMRARLVDSGARGAYWEAVPGRPFYHASDAGLPAFALLSYAGIEKDGLLRRCAIEACERAMRFELEVTGETANPFGYARFMYRDEDSGALARGFFFPRNSPAAPWWQGENARLASLATSAELLATQTEDEGLGEALRRYAADQRDWIMGLNPFDACMIEGYGRNNIQYSFRGRYDFANCPGGICNGITAAQEDGEGIEFRRATGASEEDNWRWAEQWLPHASWFLLATAAREAEESTWRVSSLGKSARP
jgi:hypothetical protein